MTRDEESSVLANAVVQLVSVLDKDQENFRSFSLPPPPTLDEVDGTLTTLGFYLRQLPTLTRIATCNELTTYVDNKLLQVNSENNNLLKLGKK